MPTQRAQANACVVVAVPTELILQIVQLVLVIVVIVLTTRAS